MKDLIMEFFKDNLNVIIAIVFCITYSVDLYFTFRDRKRHRELQERVENLKVKLTQHQQWLAVDPTAKLIVDEYLKALSDTWRSEKFKPIMEIREELGLNNVERFIARNRKDEHNGC